MNKQALPTIALVAFLAIAGVASAAAPEPRDDFGDARFGLEPNPPTPTPDQITIPATDEGGLLEFIFEGLAPGEAATIVLPDSILKFTLEDDTALTASVVGEAGRNVLTLPSHDDAAGTGDYNFTVILSHATMAVDRSGDNPADPGNPFDQDWSEGVLDATLGVFGLIEGLGGLGLDTNGTAVPEVNPDEVDLTDGSNATVTVIRHDLQGDPKDYVKALGIVDADSSVILGTAEDYVGNTTQWDNHTTPSAIESALESVGLTGLTINAVLTNLANSAKSLGVADVNEVAATLASKGWTVGIVDQVTPNPMTIMDEDAQVLTFVDGGAGKVAMSPGELFQPDDAKIVELKDTDVTKDTTFLAMYECLDCVVADDGLAMVRVDKELANYDDLLDRVNEGWVRGMDFRMTDDPVASCKESSDAFAGGHYNCYNVLPTQDGLVHNLLTADYVTMVQIIAKVSQVVAENVVESKLATVLGLGATDYVGTATGKLSEFTDQGDNLDAGRSVLYDGMQMAKADKQRFSLGQWSFPEFGLGNVPDVEGPSGPSACATCELDYDPTIVDAIYEMFQAPVLPSLYVVAIVDTLTDGAAAVVNSAGSGLAVLDTDVAKTLAPGQTSSLAFRFVRERTDLLPSTGVGAVDVDVTFEDARGLGSQTRSGQTNSDGYLVLAVPSLASFHVEGSKEGYDDVEGNGQSPASGETKGQQYTMTRNTGNAFLDVGVGFGGLLLGIPLLGIGVVLLGQRQGWIKKPLFKKRKGSKGRKRMTKRRR